MLTMDRKKERKMRAELKAKVLVFVAESKKHEIIASSGAISH